MRPLVPALVALVMLATVAPLAPALAAGEATAWSAQAPPTSALGLAMMEDPPRAPALAAALAGAYAAAPRSLEHLALTSLRDIHDADLDRPLLAPHGSLLTELSRAHALVGEPLDVRETTTLAEQVARMDPALAAALATLVAGATQADALRGDAFGRMADDDLAFLVAHAHPGAPVEPGAPLATLLDPDATPSDLAAAQDALARIDLDALHRAHLVMAAATDRALALLLEARPMSSTDVFATDTPYGRIVVRGPGSDTYAPGETHFVSIDLGGDDRYENRVGASSADLLALGALPPPPGATDPAFPAWVDMARETLHRSHNASIALDLDGNDAYVTTLGGAQGFGAFGGFGALVDAAGDDTYVAPLFAQGAGLTGGAGFLVDLGGYDAYSAVQQAQGFAIDGGAGILSDATGDDRYVAEVLAQGTGYSADLVGLLLDAEGSDRYECTGERDFREGILPVAAARPGSMCHGAGFGGTGILVDLTGYDEYVVFSNFQAFSLLGTGILVDAAGDDRYAAAEWSNAVGALGAAALVDLSGQDVYVSDQWKSVPWSDIYLGGNGAGYLGVGVLADAEGNDSYSSHARKDLWLTQYACGAGCGAIQGTGLLLDGDGNDVYVSEVGQGGGVFGVGALVDAGGDDRYLLTEGSVRGQGYAGEDHTFFLDDGVSGCWYGLLADLAGADSYSNPVTDHGARGDHAHWGQGEFGRGIDGLAGGLGYASGQLATDLGALLDRLGCNQRL